MRKTYRIFCWLDAIAPITHAAGVEGNESVLATMPVTTPDGVAHVPVLSGNTLRNRMVRDPGARWLIGQYGLSGELTRRLAAFLLNGGSMSESPREDTGRLARLHELFPFIKLVGGSLPDQILAGSLRSDFGLLVCRENESGIKARLPAGWTIDKSLRPFMAFVANYQYYRHESSRHAPELIRREDRDETSNLMPYSGGAIIAGSAFVSEIILRNVSLVELGAFLLSVDLWQSEAGVAGGKGNIGHGRLKASLHIGPDEDCVAARQAYVDHVEMVREDARAWLNDQFLLPKEEKAKGKKGKNAPPENNLLAV